MTGKLNRGRFISFIVTIMLVLFTTIVAPLQVSAAAHDPNDEDYDYGFRFWEDEVPDVGFYINASARYTLETVAEPGFGTASGEWSVMNLLRGKYTGYDYVSHIPEDYFTRYYEKVNDYVAGKNGNLDRNKSTEWSRAMLALSALDQPVTDVAGYDFIDKLSSSYIFSHRQGINGPIWEIIALNTGKYELYSDSTNEDVNTVGKMLDYILEKEIEQGDGTLGGWALASFGGNPQPDPDITGMALQALAPYYQDKELFNRTDSTATHEDVQKAVERAIHILAEVQAENGAFKAFNNVNAESTVQVLVALTALDIDPVADNIRLPAIDENVSFVTGGAVQDGVKTNNMVDALLTFWADAGEEMKGVGGFKHVTTGNDGGGGSGHGVNAMATDQSLYGLIAYDRFLKGENALYDMTDMMKEHGGTHHSDMKASNFNIHYEAESNTNGKDKDKKAHPYEIITIPETESIEGTEFLEWNSLEDGSGASYNPDEQLSMPEQDITLYAQYELLQYNLNYDLNHGSFLDEENITTSYTMDDEVTLPTTDDLERNGYSFIGWYDNPGLEGKIVTHLTPGNTGDKTYYAAWEEISDVDEEAIAEVMKLIDELPTVDELTIEHRDRIEKTISQFDHLTAKEQDLVENKEKLFKLEAKLLTLIKDETNKAAAKKVDNMIDELPSVENISLDDTDAVQEVRQAYDALSGEQQQFVTNYDKLNELENEMDRLQAEFDEKEAKKFDEVIQQLPSPEELTLGDKEVVYDAINLFNRLSTEQKALLNNIELFEAIEAKMYELEEKEADQIAAIKVDNLITGLTDISDMSLDDASSVYEAREAYNALSEKQKGLVENLKRLEVAEEQIKELEKEQSDRIAAWEVEYSIDFLPSANDITIEDEEEVHQVREAYDQLTKAQQAYVSNINKLVELEEKIKDLHDELEAEHKAAIEKVESAIASLPDETKVTLKDKAAIVKAKDLYNKLTDKQQSDVSNKEKLVTLLNKIEKLEQDKVDKDAAETVEGMIKSLPNVKEVSLENRDEINAARLAYDALTKNQKELIKNVDKLQKLEQKLKDLEKEEKVQHNDKPLTLPSEEEFGRGELDVNSQEDMDRSREGNTDNTLASNKEQNDTKEEQQKKLPRSATNMLNFLLVGAMFILIGCSYYLFKRERA